jgi:polyhydroxyalkanoate synthesis repressor PhaR
MTETRVIKRYSNRKLYDTSNSRYVTLDQIGEMVRAGEEVRIVDNATKEDLTNVTLAQIIFEEEKRKKSFLPLGTLKSILQSSGEQIQELARSLRVGAEKIIRPPQTANGEVLEVAPPPPEPTPPAEEQAQRNFFQRTLDDLQRRVDERIKGALYSLTVPLGALQRELGDLSHRLEVLERRLTELSAERPADGSEQPPNDPAEEKKP